MQSYYQLRNLRCHAAENVEEEKRVYQDLCHASEDVLLAPRSRMDENTVNVEKVSICSPSTDSPMRTHMNAESREHNNNEFIDQVVRHTSGLDVESRHNSGVPKTFLVETGSANDNTDPRVWPRSQKYGATVVIWILVFACGYGSSANSASNKRAAETFGVSGEAESLATATFLFGNGIGALLSGPISETAGRNPTYLLSLVMYLVCTLITALAPILPVQLVFRFFSGLFASPTLTIYGGSLADMYDDRERSLIWPLFATSPILGRKNDLLIGNLLTLSGPVLGPIPSGWLVNSTLVDWRWVNWLSLILGGAGFLLAFFLLPETYTPMLLTWKAHALRRKTGDDRFKSPHEISSGLWQRLATNVKRPFIFFTREPIIIALGFYLTMIYVLVFTFLDGFTYIFTKTYSFSTGAEGSAFGAIAVGVLLQTAVQPYFARRYTRLLDVAQKDSPNATVDPENRLWPAIISAPLLPISLFWLGWTNYASISYWSGLVAAGLFGFSLMGIFISSYQYVIDSYEMESSSALSSITFLRYMVAGGMVIADMPMYEALGVHWTLTLLGIIAVVLAPLPVVFMKFGSEVRAKSHFARAL
jgi:MFS family permease